MKKPEVVKRAETAVGKPDFPLAYAAAKEYLEEITGMVDDVLREDARIRAERAQDAAPAHAAGPPPK